MDNILSCKKSKNNVTFAYSRVAISFLRVFNVSCTPAGRRQVVFTTILYYSRILTHRRGSEITDGRLETRVYPVRHVAFLINIIHVYTREIIGERKMTN